VRPATHGWQMRRPDILTSMVRPKAGQLLAVDAESRSLYPRPQFTETGPST
jgi:hypothetical protein